MLAWKRWVAWRATTRKTRKSWARSTSISTPSIRTASTVPHLSGATATNQTRKPCTPYMTARNRGWSSAPRISTPPRKETARQAELAGPAPFKTFVMDQTNILIFGVGVVGCAIAHAASQRWDDVFLVEQKPHVGMATRKTSSHRW